VAQTGVALVWTVGYQYAIEARRRRKLRQAFAAYLSPYMADRIAESEFDLSLGGKEVEATIMFTDLEGFTTMSEELSPSEVSRILVEYFSTTTKAILDQDGTVIKYIGDAVMAVWGAPMHNPLPSGRAVMAAVAIQRTNRTEVAGRTLRTRIGINTGKVLAGNLGSEFRFDYTLIGAATNAASRLEGLNKYLGTDLLISGTTAAGLGEGFLTKAMDVHEVLGEAEQFNGRPAWLAEFADAVERFMRRDLDGAEAVFRRVIELRGGTDGPSEFYLKRIATARDATDDGRPWDGVISLKEK
jgi:adenylate cyclase